MCSHHSGDTARTCSCQPSGRMLGFIQPWLLLLLSEARAHGYELLEKLNQNADTGGVDPGFLYRTLRQFEGEGLVKSSWDVEGRGPARRVYEITPDGVEYLHAWADHVRSTRDRLGRLLEVYDSRFKPRAVKERR
ncbi:MAG: helix-turn-helix transcriptional regulator [Dehalococcoidia bacterium]